MGAYCKARSRAYRAYDIALRNQQQRQDDFKRNIETGAYRILEG